VVFNFQYLSPTPLLVVASEGSGAQGFDAAENGFALNKLFTGFTPITPAGTEDAGANGFALAGLAVAQTSVASGGDTGANGVALVGLIVFEPVETGDADAGANDFALATFQKFAKNEIDLPGVGDATNNPSNSFALGSLVKT